MILNEMTQAKSPRTIRIDSDSSVMSLEAMGRPSLTMTHTGQCNGFNKILCVKAKFRSMKQELAPESKRAYAKN